MTDHPSIPATLPLSVRDWSRDTLGIDALSGTDSIRSRLLQFLEAAEYLPPAAWRDAIDVLNFPCDDARQHTCAPFRKELEHRLRDALDQFVAEFFAVSRDTRKERWSRLAAESAPFLPLRVRLDRLAAGLDVNADGFHRATGQTATLAERLRIIFQSHPTHAGRHLHALQQEIARDQKVWEEAANELNRHFPDIAGLQPSLVNDTANASRSARLIARVQESQRRDYEEEFGSHEFQYWRDRIIQWSFLGVFLLIVVLVLIDVLRRSF
jgi:hypothetical protein